MSGLITRHFDAAWPVAAGVIAIAVLFALADYLEQHDHLSDVGQTTTVAALLLYALGAYLMLGDMTIGVVIGAGLSGILGGLVSSTATTVTYARRTTEDPAVSRLAAFVITTASAVAFGRILIEVAIVAPRHVLAVTPPVLIVLGIMTAISIGLFLTTRRRDHERVPNPRNPAEFKTALVFAALYGVVLLLIAFAEDVLGSPGLYGVAILSGLTDVDAVTLSLANMMNDGRLPPAQTGKLILTAGLANLVSRWEWWRHWAPARSSGSSRRCSWV